MISNMISHNLEVIQLATSENQFSKAKAWTDYFSYVGCFRSKDLSMTFKKDIMCGKIIIGHQNKEMYMPLWDKTRIFVHQG